MNVDFADPANRLFVYGSLLPTEALFYMIKPAVNRWHYQWIDGFQVMLSPNHRAFPYLVRDEEQRAYGACLTVTPSRALIDTIQMEVEAGYDLRLLGPDQDGVNLWGFVYTPREGEKMRPLPVSDWATFTTIYGRGPHTARNGRGWW